MSFLKSIQTHRPCSPAHRIRGTILLSGTWDLGEQLIAQNIKGGGMTDAMDMTLGKCPEIVRDRNAWRAIHGVAESRTGLGD